MRLLFFAALIFLLASCNSNSHKEHEPAIDSIINVSEQGVPDKNTTAEIVAHKIEKSQLPATIKFKGVLQEAWQWTDKLGDNILITSAVEPYDDKQKNQYDEQGQTAELHSFHFVKRENDWQLLWKISDAEKACPFDITTAFIKNGTTVTDLDKDGVAETTVQYKLACRSDVSPAVMKLIMHEDTAKYSLRGLMWIKASENEKFTVKEGDQDLEKQPKKKDEYDAYLQTMGRYQTEKEFSAAPPSFLDYAKRQWFKYTVETFE